MTKTTYVWRKGAIVVKEPDDATIKPIAPGVVDAVWQAMRDREDAIAFAILGMAPLPPPKPEIVFTSTPRASNWFEGVFTSWLNAQVQKP